MDVPIGTAATRRWQTRPMDTTASGSYSEIRYEVAGRVLTITLNRPERLNAFTGTMMYEMIDAFDRADAEIGRAHV